MRWEIFALVVAASCAGAPARPAPQADELKELRAQIQAQSAVVAQQGRRIEELEVKLAAISAKSPREAVPAQMPAAAPVRSEPRPHLKTVKMGARARRSDRINPVERAPRLESSQELREPDEGALDRLEADPAISRDFESNRAWAEAVRKLNAGQHAQAETDLLAFVAAYPEHTAADNALYLAGLVRESRGDCAGALQLFESVPRKYPAGDAVPQAMLERGRCLRILGDKAQAKMVLNELEQEHPDAPEAAQGLRLLQDL